jgi:hypothetical protein
MRSVEWTGFTVGLTWAMPMLTAYLECCSKRVSQWEINRLGHVSTQCEKIQGESLCIGYGLRCVSGSFWLFGHSISQIGLHAWSLL